MSERLFTGESRSVEAEPATVVDRVVCEREYEGLYRDHAPRLLRLARLLLRDPEEARDIVQDVFGKAAVALRGATAPRDWRPWLTQVLVNACRSRARRGWWRRFRRDATPLDAEPLVDGAAPPDTAAVASQVRDRVRAAFGELPWRQRQVVVLRHLEGWSTAEVAAGLRISEGAVKTHLFRGLRALREVLGEGNG
jgi:RNA polymerase sigma factor (sigma-70 family)